MAVAFAKASGVKEIAEPLARYISAGGHVTAAIGIDHQGTSRQALGHLLEMGVNLYVFHEDNSRTFHPKLYLFMRDGREGVALIGSNNLTYGGLYGNFEFGARLDLDLTLKEDEQLFGEMVDSVGWFTAKGELLNRELLTELNENGYLLDEDSAENKPRGSNTTSSGKLGHRFPPMWMENRNSQINDQAGKLSDPPPLAVTTETFVIPLTQSDVNYGSGFVVPTTARDQNQPFWGWRDLFTQGWDNKAVWHRFVDVLFTDTIGVRHEVHEIELYETTPQDGGQNFRIANARIRAIVREEGGNISSGDLLVIATSPTNEEYQYKIAIIPANHAIFGTFQQLCTRSIPNSDRRYGYSTEAPEIPYSVPRRMF